MTASLHRFVKCLIVGLFFFADSDKVQEGPFFLKQRNPGGAAGSAEEDQGLLWVWRLRCLKEFFNIVSGAGSTFCSKGSKSGGQRLQCHLLVNGTFNLLTVGINHDNEIIQMIIAGSLNTLPGLPFLQFAVPQQTVYLAGVTSHFAGVGCAGGNGDCLQQ